MSNKKAMKNSVSDFYMRIYDYFYLHWMSIIAFIVFLFVIIIGCMYVRYNSRNKAKIYNKKMFEALAIEDKVERLVQLKLLYNDKNNPNKSRDIVAIQIMKEYLMDGEYKEAKDIGVQLLKSKDVYIRYFAGLNLLMLGNNGREKGNNYKELNELLAAMEKNDNPFINLVLEQKGILFMREGKDKEARDVFNQILSKPDVDDGLRSRIREYFAVLN